ncbi:hemagglutinin/amebocyte aggregation factor-like [Pecten maximus]|uniref:hemagglutinin/amebocyte aggregation factor-like n=1 Tax=Pecten maximus TaxID=6579 RepID=UPI0014589D87|nr:hemagglutinin/amebocyte aggregation factor-like [Pecten maximus]
MFIPAGVRLLIPLIVSFFYGEVSTNIINANSYNKPLNFSCQSGDFLKNISSIHSNKHEDRKWSFTCHQLPTDIITERCTWTAYFINRFDRPMLYQCPGDSFINGFRSFHRDREEDRIWKVQCCHMRGYHRNNCGFTWYLNHFDGQLQYSVPDGKYIHGIHSIHNNYFEDRIFAFEACSFVKDNTCETK